MTWLKRAQSKPMALPFDRTQLPFGSGYEGIGKIDQTMTEETARKEQEKHNPEYLGAGTYGLATVTPMEPEVVRKYTRDEAEVQNAKQLKEHPIPCTAVIFDVIRIQEYPPLWVVESERVKQLPRHERLMLQQVFIAYPQGDFLFKDPQTILKAIRFAPNSMNIQLMEKFLQMAKCLREYDLDEDMHPGNLGYNSDGDMVLFDIGTHVPKSLDTVVEEMRRKLDIN